MLKQRLMTAAILIPLVVLSILYLSSTAIQWLLAIVTGLAAWEWFSIIGFNSQGKKLFASITLIFTTVIVTLLPVGILLILVAAIWGLVSLFIQHFAHQTLPDHVQKIFKQENVALIMATVVLALFWQCAVLLHASSELGPQQLLYAMVLVWLADTGGYFAGKRWGKKKLAKAISPNKTWEGVAGAIVLGSVWGLLAFYFGLAGSLGFIAWIFLSAATLLISVIGDLFESLFKRCYDVKDSGNLLPGHGGMLDRIDSLIAAIPVFFTGLYFLGAF
ncbi:MAG: phosphatidate cytidylyltransferase [Gammaproteobacteria bacterium]|nr:phosphatidate cytidylyltransferase [Gammaproteobacteria bacterium]